MMIMIIEIVFIFGMACLLGEGVKWVNNVAYNYYRSYK